MNSTLPNFLASPAALPAAGTNLLNASTLASLLPGLPSAPTAQDAPAAPRPEFASLMPSLPAAVLAPAGAPAPTATVAASPATVAGTLPASLSAKGLETAEALASVGAAPVVVTLAAPTVLTVANAQSWSRPARGPVGSRGEGAPAPLAGEGEGSDLADSTVAPTTAWNVSVPTALCVSAAPEAASLAEVPASSSVKSTEVPASLREQAVAFAVTLLQSLLPEVTVPGSATPAAPEGSGFPHPTNRMGYSGSEMNAPEVGGQLAHSTSSGPRASREAGATVSLPAAKENHATVSPRASSRPAQSNLAPVAHPSAGIKAAGVVPAQAVDLPEASVAAEVSLPVTPELPQVASTPTADQPAAMRVPQSSGVTAEPQPALADSPAPASAPSSPVAFAPDGAVELKFSLPLEVVDAVQLAAPALTDTPVAIHAELALPGQPVLRLEVGEGDTVTLAEPTALPGHRENFAAKRRAARTSFETETVSVERNFEFTGGKQVKPWSPVAGITVAKNDGIMSAAPTEEPRAARNPQDSTVLPVRAEFQVAQTSAERITAPAPGPSGQTFAARAVETVTGLVEAQFSASMQKSGSVHLRLKFGGEDLSVRVAIRDGAVHTDFHTDSAPLRAALEREWSAVAAASPEQMQRYAEPVFAPVAAAPSAAGQGDAQPQFARSQQQAQPDAQQQQRAPREDHHAFNRRSLMSESFVPEPPAPRVAAFLPTSLRLSALA